MIHVEYDRREYKLSAEGHAGSAPYGQDLVCAGFSTLIFTLSDNCQRLCEIGAAESCIRVIESGYSLIYVTPAEECKALVGAIMDAICIGFAYLAESFPEFIFFTVHS